MVQWVQLTSPKYCEAAADTHIRMQCCTFDLFRSILSRKGEGWHWQPNDQAPGSVCRFPFPLFRPMSLPHIFLFRNLLIISLLEWGGLSEEEEKRETAAQPQDREKSSLCGWKEMELHSACAQSVQCVLKGCEKFKVSWMHYLCHGNFKSAFTLWTCSHVPGI